MPSRPLRETKLQSVCAALLRLASERGPGAKLPPLRELAESLPASMATLTAALTELESRKVLVRKHGIGVFVSESQPRRRIALLCHPAFFQAVGSSPFWGVLIESARRRAEREREELTFFFVDDRSQAALLTGHFHGVVGIGLSQESAREIEAQGLPLVAFAGCGPFLVGFHDSTIETLGLERLRALGCQRIAVLSASDDEARGVVSQQETGYREALALFRQPPALWPDGIHSSDDIRTLGLLGAMQECGIPLDGPVRISSHANLGSPALLGWEESLICLCVDPERIVATLFDALEDAIDGAPRSGFEKIPIQVRVGSRVLPLSEN